LKQNIYTFVYLTDGSITYIIYLPLNKGGKNYRVMTFLSNGYISNIDIHNIKSSIIKTSPN